jgi:exopolyphosphatase/guanosine-5'-triphosphate,3'-diphosphate pyrophosphatase
VTEFRQELAALDLGSNSFHLIVAQQEQGQLRIIDRLNDYVRLAAGLDENNLISEEKMQEAMECLSRMGQRIRHIENGNFRTVGTNALRRAKNRQEFIRRGEEALGHPIEIISGKEEARLIYAGVSLSRSSGIGQTLVIDIGGGSTELIIGTESKPKKMESLFMGSVDLTRRFFPDGKITQRRMDDAILSATIELLPIWSSYRKLGWDSAIGSSGPIKSILKTVQGAGWCKNLITAKGLSKLNKKIIEIGHLTPKNLSGLSERRVPVFAGGVAILSACFKQLRIEKMEVSDAALREGVVFDLIGRQHDRDVRGESVKLLASRYHVDTSHSSNIKTTALKLFDQLAYKLNLGLQQRQLLTWAAELHEIGLEISHHQYHKHGAYIIANTDLTGFSLSERAILAALIRGHRRKLADIVFSNIPANIRTTVERLVLLLRLAVTLHRHRGPDPLPDVFISLKNKSLQISIDVQWLNENPLTKTEIQNENGFVSNRGYKIEIQEVNRN